MGDTLHIHALGQFAVALENLRGQTAFVLVDKLHQEFLLLGVDVVYLRHESADDGHDRLRGEKRSSFDLVVEGQNGDVIIRSGSVHRVKNAFHAEIDEVVWPLLQELGFLQNAVDEVNAQNQRNALPGLFFGFRLHARIIAKRINEVK